MISAILSLLGSSAVGSILGGVFAWLNRKTDLEARRLEFEHERSKWTHDLAVRDKDLAIAQAESKGRLDVAVVEGDATVEAARMSAIAAAQAADRVTAEELKAAGGMRWLLVLASALNKFVRPVATVVLAGAAIMLNMALIDKLTAGWATLTPTQQYDAAMQAFAWMTGQAAAVLGYWFVARGSSR